MRLGKLYFGWGEPKCAPQYLPELIICCDEKQAQRIRRGLPQESSIRVVTPQLSELRGCVYAKVTVMPGVDLSQDVGGSGSLRSILQHRQLMWGTRAILIEL